MADVPATPASATVAAPDIATQAQDSLHAASSKSSKRKTKEKKECLPAAAKIISIRNVTRASMMHRSTDSYYTELVFMDSGVNLRNPENLQMIGSSGSQLSSGSHIGFDNYVVPFEGRIRLRSPKSSDRLNRMNTAIFEREIIFKVNEPGRWVVKICL
jgi:hypothetical protein